MLRMITDASGRVYCPSESAMQDIYDNIKWWKDRLDPESQIAKHDDIENHVHIVQDEYSGRMYQTYFPEEEQHSVKPDIGSCFKMFDVFVYGDNKPTAENYLRVAKGFVQRFDELATQSTRSLYFWSSMPGTGKTLMAQCIGDALRMGGKNVRFERVVDMMNDIRTAILTKDADPSEAQLMNKYKNCDLLIMDDIGTEKVSEFADSKIFDIVDYRITHRLPMIFTANTPPNKLKYVEKVRNRIDSECTPLRFPEMSIRAKISNTTGKTGLLEFLYGGCVE